MATTAIWNVKGRLDKVVNYAKNPDKTNASLYLEDELQELGDVMDYTMQDYKTEKKLFEKVLEDPQSVFQLAEQKKKVILLKDNRPVFVILKYADDSKAIDDSISQRRKRYTLHEAMKIVFLDADDKTMHAADLAEEIYRRDLYVKKDGGKAQYNQIRARCGHYPNMFEPLPGNIIKLKEGAAE